MVDKDKRNYSPQERKGSKNSSGSNDFDVTQLSGDKREINWAIAVFAYNEANTIQAALNSIAENTRNEDVGIYVLANGCTDSTAQKVIESAATIDNLWLVETDIADKANAWNVFIHGILSSKLIHEIDVCFFMDGDVTLVNETLPKLASILVETPTAEAAGAMPATGRDRDAWRQRMAFNNMLAGNCYALRSSFIQFLRERDVRMPVGLIGEDFLVSWLVANSVWGAEPPANEGIRCVFRSDAEFAFRSLSPWRLSDYRTYVRRKWRYTLRGLQHQMLVLLLMNQGLGAMPRDINELYRRGPLPSRLVWCGFDSLLRLIAIHRIRAIRGRS